MRGLICRKTATSLSSTALVTWRNFVAVECIQGGDVRYYGGSAEKPPSYQYKNGSEILIGGLDKITKIMSSEYDIIYVQEATELTEDDWESLTSRLRNWKISFQQMIADCNPSFPTHWLNNRCTKGLTQMLETRHEDNPVLFDNTGHKTERGKDYIEKLDRLTGVRYERLRQGRWTAAEGMIFEDYSQDQILDVIPHGPGEPVDRAGVPLSWERIWSVDFGFTNPFVLHWWAEDPDGRLFMYREIYMTHRTVDQHALTAMMQVCPDGRWVEPEPTVIVCDHDAEGRAVLENTLGMSTSPAHKSVLEGIDSTQKRFRVQPDGRKRIFFLRTALVEIDLDLQEAGRPISTIDEIPGYVWKLPKDGSTKREEPEKKDDHGCDAMRYVVAEREFGDRPIFRSFTAGTW